jgi:hypothetical protein
LSSQLDEARAIRERLQRAEQQLRDAETRAGGSSTTTTGEPSRAASGREGKSAADAGRDVQRLRDEYQRELQRAEDALRRLNGGSATNSLGGSTPNSRSSAGPRPARKRSSRTAPVGSPSGRTSTRTSNATKRRYPIACRARNQTTGSARGAVIASPTPTAS